MNYNKLLDVKKLKQSQIREQTKINIPKYLSSIFHKKFIFQIVRMHNIAISPS